jgi:hypothetical protein
VAEIIRDRMLQLDLHYPELPSAERDKIGALREELEKQV